MYPEESNFLVLLILGLFFTGPANMGSVPFAGEILIRLYAPAHFAVVPAISFLAHFRTVRIMLLIDTTPLCGFSHINLTSSGFRPGYAPGPQFNYEIESSITNNQGLARKTVWQLLLWLFSHKNYICGA